MSLTASSQNIPKIMVFRPTLEEMGDFSGYISYMEDQGAHKAGIAKVIPPKEFVPRKNYEDLDMVIPAPIQQEVMGHQGLYTQYNIQKKAMTVKEFAKLANSAKYQTPPHFGYEDLERKYWKNVTYNPPIYGADISGSVYDKGVDIWNINRLNTVLDIIEEEQGVKIEGVNTAYLYFGMWKTTFAWHTEDLDLYSINYLHYGAPKSWYAIPPEHGKRLERLAEGFFPGNFKICSNFLRHKMSIIAPHILKKYSIPFNKITQEKGEFMVTFPYGYHSGFNHGYNCAESTNFASLRWINYGKRASCCTCQKDSVKISMEPFVRVFQPDRYEAWKDGKDSLYLEEVDNPTGFGSKEKHMKEPPMLPFTNKSDELPRRHPVHKKDGRRTNSPNALPQKKKKKKVKVEEELEVEVDSKDGVKDAVLFGFGLKKSKKKKEMSGDGDASNSSRKVADGDVDGKKKKKTPKKVKSKDGDAKKRKADGAGDGESPTKKKKTEKGKDSDSSVAKEKKKQKKKVDTGDAITSISELIKKKKKKVKQNDGAENGEKAKRGRPKGSTAKGVTKAKAVAGALALAANPSSSSSSSLKPSSQPKVEDGMSDEEEQRVPISESSRWAMFDHRYSSIKPNGKASTKQTYKHKHQPRPTREEEGRRQMVRMRKGKAFTVKETRAMKDWARSLNGLWVTQPTNFMMEQVHNASMADQKPGCCVCRIFYHDKLGIYDEDESGKTVLVGSSQDYHKFVLTPEDCFAATEENSNPVCHNALIDVEACSPILTCVSCKMAVHASCYGEAPPGEGVCWTCQRCREDDKNAVCCLCNLRGGALKHTTHGKWAHIMCAMAIPEIRFVNVEERDPIDCSNISEARLKLKCFFCRSFIKYSPKFGSCIQCSVGKCAISFHVTCANAAGVIMEPGLWPCAVFATCIRHPVNVKDWTRIRKMKEIHAGDRVIAKHKNNRYYTSVVKGEKAQVFCHVEFKEDQSFCDNLYPEDIESHSILLDGPPEVGSDVEVRWIDGVLYPGTFLNSYSTKMYEVLFEDGSVIMVKKEDIYKDGEPMPKRVRQRMSEATDKRYIGFEDLVKIKSSKVKSLKTENESNLETSTSATSLGTVKQERTDNDSEAGDSCNITSPWAPVFPSPASDGASTSKVDIAIKEEVADEDSRLEEEEEEDEDSQVGVNVTALSLPFTDTSGTITPTLQGAMLIASTTKTDSDSPSVSGASEGHVSFPNDASLKLDTVSFRPGESLPKGKTLFSQ